MYLQASDIGLILYQRAFSSIGRSPTKLGEYWASGIPALSLKKIGDLDFIFNKYPYGGELIDSLNKSEINQAFEKLLLKNDKEKLLAIAKEYYHINNGVNFYKNIYKEILSNR